MGRKQKWQCGELADEDDGLCDECRDSRCYEPGERGPKVKVDVNGGSSRGWTRVVTVELGGPGGSGTR